MNLFDGLEKFGIKASRDVGLYDEERQAEKEEEQKLIAKASEPKEEDFLLEKTVRCPVCDKTFKCIAMKTGKAKRMESDWDLRPRQQYIDGLKYDMSACPHCGYAALNRYFDHITTGQIKLIREQVCDNFQPTMLTSGIRVCSYDEAIEKHKLSLFNAVAKRARTSEKAYNCLIISWLLRGKSEELGQDHPEYQTCVQEEEAFYKEAYEGLVKAVASESYPICGMDQNTMDYLLSAMSFHFKKYDVASKCLSRVLTSSTANHKVKDMALELKSNIIAELKKK
ncbi:MAG: DUF2225 domain-containing protein [Roseburia sp.]